MNNNLFSLYLREQTADEAEKLKALQMKGALATDDEKKQIEVLDFDYAIKDDVQDIFNTGLSYKGRRYVLSGSGITAFVNHAYTADECAARIDKSFIQVDGENEQLTDFVFAKNEAEVIQAGVVYTTSAARESQKQAYHRTTPIESGEYKIRYIADNGVAKVIKVQMKTLTPVQLDNFWKQIKLDTLDGEKAIFGELTHLTRGAACLTDFSSLYVKGEKNESDGSLMKMDGNSFGDEVVSILHINSPFASDYDETYSECSGGRLLKWIFNI